MALLDWSQCPAVESIPWKVSGAWVLRNTRMPVATIFENREAGGPALQPHVALVVGAVDARPCSSDVLDQITRVLSSIVLRPQVPLRKSA